MATIARSQGTTGPTPRARVDLASLLAIAKRWQLQEAKLKLSSVVREALEGRPQCISRHGKDVVVLMSLEQAEQVASQPESLYEFFRRSPLVGLDIEFERAQDPPREVDL